uniref:(California timema) hypothetical protein n=1 Tax=Timema californicum TaxID=61474 RepID=A0A7R9JDI7_TIMCA|nr:unnamed protein product [Timema californicum]
MRPYLVLIAVITAISAMNWPVKQCPMYMRADSKQRCIDNRYCQEKDQDCCRYSKMYVCHKPNPDPPKHKLRLPQETKGDFA